MTEVSVADESAVVDPVAVARRRAARLSVGAGVAFLVLAAFSASRLLLVSSASTGVASSLVGTGSYGRTVLRSYGLRGPKALRSATCFRQHAVS